MIKKIKLENILGITISKTKSSNQIVIHHKEKEEDYIYTFLRKNEFIITMDEVYYKLINQKLKFSVVKEEALGKYVTSQKQKSEEDNFTLMKDDNYTIDDVKKMLQIEIDLKENVENDQIKNEETNQILKNDENNKLGDNLIKENEKKNQYDCNLNDSSNPFRGVLVGGTVTFGAGIATLGGCITACIALDSAIITATTGYAFAFGMAANLLGIGIILAVPGLLGFGGYKIYKTIKDKARKEFFESFNLPKMVVEKEFQSFAISKIDKYFIKMCSIENKKEIEKEINECINNIIETYILIDDNKLESLINLGENNLLEKIYRDSEIIANNIPKIRQELMEIILTDPNKNLKQSFEKVIPMFKEFIYNFGPQTIEQEDQKKIDKNIERVIEIMKDMIDKKIAIAIKKFDKKFFKKSFEIELDTRYEQKKQLDDIKKSKFIDNCNDFIIEPLADNVKNYGILSLVFYFTLMIQKICVDKKLENYKKNKNKLQNLLENSSKQKEDIKDINIIFIINKKDKVEKINIKGNNEMTVEELISNIKNKIGDENYNIKRCLIANKTEVSLTSKEKLQDLGIGENTEIMLYQD